MVRDGDRTCLALDEDATLVAARDDPAEFVRALYHYRDKDQNEVDIVVEGGGRFVGIEVKAAASVKTADFKGLRKLADACGGAFKLGIVLYDGETTVPFGERLFAAPVGCL